MKIKRDVNNPCYAVSTTFFTNASLSISEAWIDVNESLIVTSNDGNIVIIPKECIEEIRNLIKEN